MRPVALASIVFDASTQVRATINEQVVNDYSERMEAGDRFPPVVLFHDGNRYYMADGFHRGFAAKRNGLNDIPADVHAGTQADALWFALGANRANGHQMTCEDKRHAILLALKTWGGENGKSMSLIAEQVGCALSYAQSIEREVTSTGKLQPRSRVTGKDGKSYPASRGPNNVPSPHGTSPAVRPDTQRRADAAVDGAPFAMTKRLPRKNDGEIVSSAVQTLRGLIGAFQTVDPAALSSDPRAEEWRTVVAETIHVLRKFNQQCEKKAV